MKFSVIIPVYNAENTLRECLAAIYRSSYPDFEVIVINDASDFEVFGCAYHR